MDTKTFLKNLKTVFSEPQLKDKRYAQVWLSDIDMGGLYRNGKFGLHVKAGHLLASCFKEIDEIVYMLRDKAREELKLIWWVKVYNVDDGVECTDDDLLVFDENNVAVK